MVVNCGSAYLWFRKYSSWNNHKILFYFSDLLLCSVPLVINPWTCSATTACSLSCCRSLSCKERSWPNFCHLRLEAGPTNHSLSTYSGCHRYMVYIKLFFKFPCFILLVNFTIYYLSRSLFLSYLFQSQPDGF